MKKNEKRMILILLIVLVIAIVLFAISKKTNNEEKNITENVAEENNIVEEHVQILEDGTKLNISEQLKKEKQVGVYKFENIQLTEQDSQTVLLADVTNTSEKETDVQIVDVTLLDKNGQEIITVGGIIEGLAPGEKTQFNTSMTLDYANTYDFKITLK